ncbi:hypothetical protein OJ996_24570 [Luteolibacter sp. GHJ8]|uniref:Peptidase S74 domain-containing protein n=1 Tax=Luteolibacter rhizosphaerae TaxID=2989719 RepID=A0ABT3GAH8_9BACT|nr:hypothetical protein [Luteolibacter rhizosphaerae]MCW1916785.1 hypothetical protein [Luteolibacter rhizosphaerae]
MADIDEGHIRRYRPVLDKEDFTELSRSIGLASHGVGIGSFIYLRRIFERLVEEAHKRATTADHWDEEAYSSSRMDDKIRMLSNELPPFLVEQRGLYGILSKGVHALDEDTCTTYYPVIRAGIELILDQKLELARQKKKMEEAKAQIAKIHQTLKTPKS